MAAEYPFNVDVNTVEGQMEALRLWSSNEIGESAACLILKVTTAELLALANAHGVPAPPQQAFDQRIKELEAIVRPHLRATKRNKVEKTITETSEVVTDLLHLIANIAMEAEAYGRADARALYSVAHARLRRSLDSIMSAQVSFAEARTLEESGGQEFEYDDASLKVLQGLDRVVPRPDYYLIGDFDHVNPVTERDILWSWSQGFLTTQATEEMLKLEEGDTLDEVANQLGVPLPPEEAVSPREAALILGDDPAATDPTLNVRRRIRDGRLASYFRSVVEARRAFEDKVKRPPRPTEVRPQ